MRRELRCKLTGLACVLMETHAVCILRDASAQNIPIMQIALMGMGLTIFMSMCCGEERAFKFGGAVNADLKRRISPNNGDVADSPNT